MVELVMHQPIWSTMCKQVKILCWCSVCSRLYICLPTVEVASKQAKSLG